MEYIVLFASLVFLLVVANVAASKTPDEPVRDEALERENDLERRRARDRHGAHAA